MTLSGNNIVSMKRDNRKAVLSKVRQHGAVSRKFLAESLQLTPAAITKIVGNLIDDGLLTEGGSVRAEASAGRSQILLQINSRARAALGVMLNVHRATLSGVWLDGSLIFCEEVPLESPCDPAETAALLAQRLRAHIAQCGLDPRAVIGLGVAARGVISRDRRVLTDSRGVFRGSDIPIADLFESATGFAVTLENNVRALLAAQLFLDRESQNECQLFLRCEYGIGAALSIGGEIWSGGGGRCSEIGHIQVVRRGGLPCVCGKSGCLETIASPSAMRAEAQRALSPDRTPLLWEIRQSGRGITLTDVLDSAANGDAGAAYIVDRGVRALGQALKSALYIIDPQRVVLYGSLFEHRGFLARLMAEMAQGLDRDHADIPIEKSAYNGLLDPAAAGILSVNRFFDAGGEPVAAQSGVRHA